MAEFTPVGVLAQQSQGAWDAMTDSIRRQSAYNALRKVYGPIAGDPVNALRMQAYGQNEQMNPLQIQNQQLVNQGRQQQNSYLGQSYPLQLQQQQQEVTQAGQKTEDNAMSLASQKALKTRGVLSGALSALGGDDDGTPQAREAKWQQVIQRSAGLLGVDPAQLDGSLAGQKNEYLTGGAAALPKMQQELDSVTLGAMSPLDRAKVVAQQQAASTNAARENYINAQTDTTKARTGLITAQTKQVGKPKNAVAPGAPGSFTDSRVTGMLGAKSDWSDPENPGLLAAGPSAGAIGRALAAVDQMPDSVLARGLGEYANRNGVGHAVVAATMPQLNAYLTAADQIGHNLPLDDYRSLKEQGGSLGRVTNTEFLALKGAISSLDSAQNKDQIRNSLIQIAQLYQRMQDRDTVARGGKAIMPDFQNYEATQQSDPSNIAADQALQSAQPQVQQPAVPAQEPPDPTIMNAPADLDPSTTQSIAPQPGAASSPAPAAAPQAGPQQPAAQFVAPFKPGPEMFDRRVPASIRTNNPGAMWFAPWQKKYGASGGQALADGTGQNNNIAMFPSKEAGAAAQFELLQRRYSKYSLLDAVRKWSGGNAGVAYASRIAQATGSSLNTPVSQIIADPAKAIAFASAAAGVEAGRRKYPMTREQWATAYQLFRSGGSGNVAVAAAPAAAGAPAQQVAAAAPQGVVQGPAPRNALLPPGASDLGQGTAADYQPQTGPATAAAAPQAPSGGDGGVGPGLESAGALGAPPAGPGAVTPPPAQVAWEQVLPYLPELLSMLQERRKGRA